MTLAALIAQLAEAKEGSRKLDREIFLAINPDWIERGLVIDADNLPPFFVSARRKTGLRSTLCTSRPGRRLRFSDDRDERR
jgi:hypothetical protein